MALFSRCVLVSDVSPVFISIYNQALVAQTMGLIDVCGPGYRKALEFLVNDFLIRQKPDEEQKLRATALANCIAHHIGDERLKAVAAREVELGNDETHYGRRWTDKNVRHLTDLIWLTTRWMELVLGSEHYGREMPS